MEKNKSVMVKSKDPFNMFNTFLAVDNDCNSFDFVYDCFTLWHWLSLRSPLRSCLLMMIVVATKNLRFVFTGPFLKEYSNTVIDPQKFKNFHVTHSTYTLRDSSTPCTTVANSKHGWMKDGQETRNIMITYLDQMKLGKGWNRNIVVISIIIISSF